MPPALVRTSLSLDTGTLGILGELAKRWSISKAEVMRRSISSYADCMIAATTIVAGRPLATFNRSDFEKLVPFGLVLEG